MSELWNALDDGELTVPSGSRTFAESFWNLHPEFAGVFMKNLVTPEDTGRRFTCHMVKIEPGAKIGLHTHPASVELHEVVEGSGACIIDGREVGYGPGSMAVMPAAVPHEVRAGKEGLLLLAKFVMV